MEEIYTPFVQKTATGTFTGTIKFAEPSKSDPKQQFENELEKMRYAFFVKVTH